MDDFVCQELDGERAKQYRQHLASCYRCKQLYREMESDDLLSLLEVIGYVSFKNELKTQRRNLIKLVNESPEFADVAKEILEHIELQEILTPVPRMFTRS